MSRFDKSYECKRIIERAKKLLIGNRYREAEQILEGCYQYYEDENLNKEILIQKSIHSITSKGVLSSLGVKNFRMISILNFLGIIVLNILNSIITILIINIPSFGIPLNLPGTGIMGSESLKVSSLFHILLIISPLLTSASLILIYREVNKFNQEDLDKIIKNFPPNVKIQIIENLKELNEKIKKQMKIE